METFDFMSTKTVVDLALDKSTEPTLRVEFNITMMDLRCEFATIDVVSVLGNTQNVSQNIRKWSIDADGVRDLYTNRKKNQVDIEMKDEAVSETLEELHKDGEDAINLDTETLQYARDENEYLFVDFFASWCSHCIALAPTWETLAEVMSAAAEAKVHAANEEREHKYTDEEYEEAMEVELPVMIAKVDCVTNHNLCNSHHILAYPTLRLFVDGEPYVKGDYRGHRTVLEMAKFLMAVEEDHKKESEDPLKVAGVTERLKMGEVHRVEQAKLKNNRTVSEKEKKWTEGVLNQRHRMYHNTRPEWHAEDHPGCTISGSLNLNRVPGNFHIQARSKSHNLVAHMTNVSHEIHRLAFGETETIAKLDMHRNKRLPEQFHRTINPMDGNVYVTYEVHQAHHHYLKVVTTHFDRKILGRAWKQNWPGYQVLGNSQLSYYRNDTVPEAKFTIDLSPISASYRVKSRPWYDYLTSLMAIIGGTFTVVGMLEGGLRQLSSKTHHA
eukprot:scaffold5469_cov54-Attheya_sp.AAC.3